MLRQLHAPSMLLSGIWLFYLAFPAVGLFQTHQSAWLRGVGIAILALFMVVYLLGFGLSDAWEAAGQRAQLWVWTGLLAALMAGMIPLIGGAAFAMVTFVVASICFPHPPRVGWAVGGTLALVGFVLARALPPHLPWSIAAMSTLVGSSVVLVVSGLVHRQEAEAAIRHQLATVSDRERIARDVHDVLGHSLTVINLKAELATRLVEADPAAARGEIEQIAELSREALAEARATVMQVREASLAEELRAAVRALEAAGIEVQAPEAEHAESVAGPRGVLFASVLREAVTNTVRHADASRCVITVTRTRLSVKDDGVGCAGAVEGTGLKGLRARVAAEGGSITLRTAFPDDDAADGGTAVVVEGGR